MTDAREIIALELARISKIDMSEAPPYARASIHTAAMHIERALTAAGLRIIGKDEVDPVTDEMVEAAQDAWEEADNDTGDLDACWRAALKAAMEAGR